MWQRSKPWKSGVSMCISIFDMKIPRLYATPSLSLIVHKRFSCMRSIVNSRITNARVVSTQRAHVTS